MDEEKWQGILDQVKKKGRRTKRIRKTAGILSFCLILGAGTLTWILPENQKNMVYTEDSSDSVETLLMTDLTVYYDPDFGLIAQNE